MDNLGRTIPVDTIVSLAMVELAENSDNDRGIFIEWAYQAVRSIGVYPLWHQKEVRIPVENLCAEKPCDYLKGVDLRVVDSNTCGFVYPIYRGTTEWGSCFGGGKNIVSLHATLYHHVNGGITFTQDSKYFYFSSPKLIDGGTSSIDFVGEAAFFQGFDFCDLTYLSLPLDSEGYPMIVEYLERAVIAYIVWKAKIRMNNQKCNSVRLDELQMLKQEWLSLKGDAMGEMGMPDRQRMIEISATYLSMIPKISRSRDFTNRT